MSKALRTLTLAIGILWACRVSASEPYYNYSDKTVSELLELLENKDSTVRECAETFIEQRYHNPMKAQIDAPPQKPNSPSPELPIPPQVVLRLAQHLKGDPDLIVRLGAVDALREIRYYTNTVSNLVAGFDDRDPVVRIRTCLALIDISHDYSEPLADLVIPTLTKCLAPDGEVATLWYAAWASGRLGGAGKPLVPALEKLLTHESSKVRDYAKSALLKIEHPDEESRKQ